MDETEHTNVDVFTTANSMNVVCSDGAYALFKDASSENSLQGQGPE
jgi:hypothetical protein